VSLRDLAATIVDVLGFQADPLFPGESLARFWQGSPPGDTDTAAASDPALSEVVPLESFGPDPSQWFTKPRWPLAALIDGDWTYIRREADRHEELFHLRGDARERHNRAAEPALQPVLERLRAALVRLTAGPLTPQRFNP
jgi:arylsulfatase A-like enzyme